MPDLTEFSDSARRLALERYRKLQPHLEQNVPLLQVARAAALPIRTARRWVHRYRHFGLAGLTRRGRADHGKRRSISPTLLNLVEGLALQKPSLPVAAVHREACRIALAQGERLPGYHSVYRAINTVPPALKTLAHDGGKPIAKPTTCFIAGKLQDPMNSGRPITPNSICGPNATAARSRDPG